MSAGLVEPGLFFRPLKFDLTSVPFTRISIWFGNAISGRTNVDTGSTAQNTIILSPSRGILSLENLAATSGESLNLSSKVALLESAPIHRTLVVTNGRFAIK